MNLSAFSPGFTPYFFTQFFGAFNDNLYKNSLLILIAFHWSKGAQQDHLIINLAAALFILPFFFLSPLAGRWADHGRKVHIIKIVKFLEVVIMAAACVAIYQGAVYTLLGLLCLMGCQSALFGPVKYAIIPELTEPEALLKANALVSASTYVSILLGTICGGLAANAGIFWVCLGIMAFALAGWLSSLMITGNGTAPAPPRDHSLGFDFVRQQPHLLVSILLISWFWLQGAAYLTQIPTLSRDILKGGPGTVTLLLSLFTLSVAAGAGLCALLSRGKIRLSLVKTGSAGLLLGGLLLYALTPSYWGVCLSIVVIGSSGGLYIVPLYTALQRHSEAQQRSRIFAVNNVFNALFMVLAAVLGMILLGQLAWQIPHYLGLVALGNVAAVFITPHFPSGEYSRSEAIKA